MHTSTMFCSRTPETVEPSVGQQVSCNFMNGVMLKNKRYQVKNCIIKYLGNRLDQRWSKRIRPRRSNLKVADSNPPIVNQIPHLEASF